jgi:peptidoglycan/LPS O-acetylase OafA/YrhL
MVHGGTHHQASNDPCLQYLGTSQCVLSLTRYYANVHFAQRVNNYFDPEAASSPVLHFWSLSVEEQFYFAWPLAVATTVWFCNKCGASTAKRFAFSWRSAVLTMVAVGCVLSLLLNVWQLSLYPTRSYFNTFQRAWELFAGCWLAVNHSDSEAEEATLDAATPGIRNSARCNILRLRHHLVRLCVEQ